MVLVLFIQLAAFILHLEIFFFSKQNVNPQKFTEPPFMSFNFFFQKGNASDLTETR